MICPSPLLVASAEGPGASAVLAELHALHAAADRPGVAQTALALALIMGNRKAVGGQPAAAKVLAALLDKLRQSAAPGRRGHFAAARTMTKNGGA